MTCVLLGDLEKIAGEFVSLGVAVAESSSTYKYTRFDTLRHSVRIVLIVPPVYLLQWDDEI
jgi:hypothetical protein